MYRDFMPEMANLRREELLAEAGRRRLGRLAKGKERLYWRRGVVRALFDAAFALEPEESWRAMWDRMSRPDVPDRPQRAETRKRYVS